MVLIVSQLWMAKKILIIIINIIILISPSFGYQSNHKPEYRDYPTQSSMTKINIEEDKNISACECSLPLLLRNIFFWQSSTVAFNSGIFVDDNDDDDGFWCISNITILQAQSLSSNKVNFFGYTIFGTPSTLIIFGLLGIVAIIFWVFFDIYLSDSIA